MMACTEPSSTVRLTSLRARRPAKLLSTFLTCRMLMAGPSFGAVRLLDRHPGPVRLGPATEQAGQPRKSLDHARSEEHTSELQSLMRISYAVFCLKKKTKTKRTIRHR